LLLAATLAGVLGVERELTEQPAGFRTHILVGLGAALFSIVSAYGFQSIVAASPRGTTNADVTRIASQIVVGLGFLGGGAIMNDAEPAIDLQKLLSTVRSAGAVVDEVRLTEEGNEAFIRLAVRQSRRVQPAELAAKIASTQHVRNVEWSK